MERGRWPFSMTVLEHGAFAFCGLLVYVLVTRIGQHRRQPSAAVAWVLVIAMFPYVGLPLFLLFGTRKFARPGVLERSPRATTAAVRAHLETLDWDSRQGRLPPPWATSLLECFALPPPSKNPVVQFHVDGGQSWQALSELLQAADRSIDVCTFVLGHDEVGDALVDELMRASGRGVRVRLLLDAFGSRRASRSRLRALETAGGAVRWFMPLLHNPLRGRTNLRNHRKLAIADDLTLWSGGRNQAIEYFLDRSEEPAWEDLSFVVTGPVVNEAQALFEHDWEVASGRVPQSPLRRPTGQYPLPGTDVGATAQLIPSGPDYADDTVYSLMLSAAYHARERILAVTPYFVPDDALLSAWCLACRRGVEVTLLLPARSNHLVADLARERSLRQLQQAGGRVLLFPGMLHAKAVVVDDQVALCGTVNLDARSLFLNFELMFAFYDRNEIEWLVAWIMARCHRSKLHNANLPTWSRDIVEGIVRAVGYQL